MSSFQRLASSMASSSALDEKRLVKLVDQEIQSFDNQVRPLLTWQLDSLSRCLELLREDENSLTQRSKQSRSNRLRARDFFVNVFTAVGPEVFLLCILAVPISSAVNVSSKNAIAVLRTWWSSVSHPEGLAIKAKELCEDSSVALLVSPDRKRKYLAISTAIDHESPSKSNHTQQTNEFQQEDFSLVTTKATTTAANNLSANNSNFTTAEENLVLEYASIEGLLELFDQNTCDAVRKVMVKDELRAAVTMVFPVWVTFGCLMSLDICEADVAGLAMSLFGVEVQRVRHGLRVTFHDGPSVMMTSSEEIALKGASSEAIVKVFGVEINDAILQGPVRKEELAQGKHVTECVSMNFTKTGAIINLSLDLEGGQKLQHKLY